jgi:hypothetical protein
MISFSAAAVGVPGLIGYQVPDLRRGGAEER